MKRVVYLIQLRDSATQHQTAVVVGYSARLRENDRPDRADIPRSLCEGADLLCFLTPYPDLGLSSPTAASGLAKCRGSSSPALDHAVKEQDLLAWVKAGRPADKFPSSYPLSQL